MFTRFGMGLMLAFAPRVGQSFAQGIAVIGAVGQQGLAVADAVQHVLGAAAVMGLAFGQFQGERIAVGIDHGMDFGGQSAARAPHASACRDVPSGGFLLAPFLPLAACW